MSNGENNSPFDDTTHWLGKLPKTSKKEDTNETTKDNSKDDKAD